MQGQLQNRDLTVRIDSECAASGRPITLEINNHLDIRVREEGCRPIVFVPDIDLFSLEDDSIIQAF